MTSFLNPTIIIAFISTFFFVSLTPGLCMTLAMTLGITVGFRKTLWMMLGELVGVGMVVVLSATSMAAIITDYPEALYFLKYIGGAYLAYIGINLWFAKGKMAASLEDNAPTDIRKLSLISQGFMTAISNPKGWAFFISLLPPFIEPDKSLSLQLILFTSIILFIEFLCLCLYAAGGNVMRNALSKKNNLKLLNRLSGSLMIGVAVWLAFGA